MKKRALIFANFVVLLAPILVFAVLALGIAGMGGAFDRYDGTWVGTVLESLFTLARTFWIVAALINLGLTTNSVARFIGAFVDVLFGRRRPRTILPILLRRILPNKTQSPQSRLRRFRDDDRRSAAAQR